MRPMNAALAALAAAAVLAACSTTPSPAPSTAGVTPAAVPTLTLTPTGAPRTIEFSVKLTSAGTQLTKVGPEEQITYGWNDLRGPTTVNGEQVEVRLQGSVWYVNGAGPWTGFFTVTFADGSVLALAARDATAFKASDTVTDFRGTTVVIGGTGRFANATGSGTALGSRDTAIGGEVSMTLVTEVRS